MVLIPLRAKYRRAHRGKYKGGEHAVPLKKRKKVTDKKKLDAIQASQPQMVKVVDGKTGHGVMQRR